MAFSRRIAYTDCCAVSPARRCLGGIAADFAESLARGARRLVIRVVGTDQTPGLPFCEDDFDAKPADPRILRSRAIPPRSRSPLPAFRLLSRLTALYFP